MDPGEELAGAGGFHACSLPRAHASRSFSAGGAPSACLTPLMLRSLAAPLLITSESCFWVPPAMGVSHHTWRMLCPPPLPSTLLLCGECSPSTCLPCALCLNTHKTHPPPLLHHTSGGGHEASHRFPRSPPGHQASGAFAEPAARGGKPPPAFSGRLGRPRLRAG